MRLSSINPEGGPSPEAVFWLAVAAFWLVASLLATSCTHVCAKTWETGVEVSHSPYFGPGYGTHATVGGEIGPSQCRSESK